MISRFFAGVLAAVGVFSPTFHAHIALSNARITHIQAWYDYSNSLVRIQKAMGMGGNRQP
jgi:hypothetical protein